MNTFRKAVSLALFPVFLACCLWNGCALFKGHQLPEVKEFPLGSFVSKLKHKPSVCIITIYHGDGESGPAEKVAPKFAEAIMDVAEASSLFSSVSTIKGASCDYKVELDLSLRWSDIKPEWGCYPAVICPASILVIPWWLIGEYKLKASVEDREGEKLAVYEYRDNVSLWLHLALIPATPVLWPCRVMKVVLHNMLKRFFNDLSRDILRSQQNE